MAQPIQMPLRGTPNTPKFDGKNAFELPCYLEDIDFLGNAVALMAPQKIKAAICYAILDDVEVWQTLLEVDANAADWGLFVIVVKGLYPGCEGTDRYCHVDIQYLVQDHTAKLMRNQDDLGEYT